MSFFRLAERRIEEGRARGLLDNLPGAGGPLAPDGPTGVSSEVNALYRLVARQGGVPAEVVWLRRAYDLRRRLEDAPEADQERLLSEIRALELRIALAREKRKRFERS